MTDRSKLKDRARDELFSHINRCGVLQATHKDQEDWLNETMEYLGERYPDMTVAELKELYNVGLRFCRPAIPHGNEVAVSEGTDGEEEGTGGTVGAGVEEAAS